MVTAKAMLGDRFSEMRERIVDVWRRRNNATDGRLLLPQEYLISIDIMSINMTKLLVFATSALLLQSPASKRSRSSPRRPATRATSACECWPTATSRRARCPCRSS
jgi:hypothetical protein